MNKLKGYGKILNYLDHALFHENLIGCARRLSKMIKNINVEAEKNIFISIHADADFFLVYD